jgi:hypothetical protein
LEILLEIENRKEYSGQGFDGLYSFCIKTFGWSESQTATRTQAMYAVRTVPDLKQKIDDGTMSVTTIAQVERYIRQEQVEAGTNPTPEDRRSIFESFSNKTSTEVRNEIAERKGGRIKLKLHLELDEEAEELWKEVRNQSAHSTQGSALNCLKVLMRSYLEKKCVRSGRSGNTNIHKSGTQESSTQESSGASQSSHAQQLRRTTSSLTKVSPRFIPAATRRAIYEKSSHQCENCGSRHALQIDHIHPVAKGGTNDPDNLRVLCRNCNLSRARQIFQRASIARAQRQTG